MRCRLILMLIVGRPSRGTGTTLRFPAGELPEISSGNLASGLCRHLYVVMKPATPCAAHRCSRLKKRRVPCRTRASADR